MKYTPEYESELLRGVEDERPWDFLGEVVNHTSNGTVLVDVGCGTATKLVQIAQRLGELSRGVTIYGVEPVYEMRARARENIVAAGLDNIRIVDGFDEKIPFADETVDVVTGMVAPHDVFELHRVLRDGGHAIIEKIGDRDKHDVKVLFGDDEVGPRAYSVLLREGQRVELYKRQFSLLFSEVEVTNGFWDTYYSTEGISRIFEQTSSVRDFDREGDALVLAEIERRFMTDRGIKMPQNRVLIKARK